MMRRKRIMMVAGEASGDLHGSHLIHALRRLDARIDICGMGGRAMRAAGADIVVDADDLAVVGITEVVAKLGEVFRAMRLLKRLLHELRPDLLILIDYPEFNLHLAGAAKKAGMRVLYYISPQLWAWRSGRVRKIRARVDHMAVILPFEAEFYERHGVPVSFVGHPLMDSATGRAMPRTAALADQGEIVIGLLPGSRPGEVSRLLPVMLQAAVLLRRKNARLRFIISSAPSVRGELIHGILAEKAVDHIEITQEPVAELLPRCHLAIVASGTVTLEGAICGTPMIITYVVSPLSYWLGRALIRVDHIGLVNLIAGKRLVPELVQHQVSAAAISEEAGKILGDPAAYRRICRELAAVRQRLGTSGASAKVAALVMHLLAEDRPPSPSASREAVAASPSHAR